MRVREALTFIQTYTARVASALPVLLSAIRVSPPSEGPAHDGKIIGKDVVSYVYKQVCAIFASQD
jgi:leukotriene-A4 hydrolase